MTDEATPGACEHTVLVHAACHLLRLGGTGGELRSQLKFTFMIYAAPGIR